MLQATHYTRRGQRMLGQSYSGLVTLGDDAAAAAPIDIARICLRGAGSFEACSQVPGLTEADITQLRQEFPSEPTVTAAPIDIARTCLRGKGSLASCSQIPGLTQTDITQLQQEFPAPEQKFFDLKNPMFWLAAGVGVVGVIGVGYLLFGGEG